MRTIVYLAVNASALQELESRQMRKVILEADESAAAEQRAVGQRSGDELSERDEHEQCDEEQGGPDEEPGLQLPRALRSLIRRLLRAPTRRSLAGDVLHLLARLGDRAVDVAVENSALQHVDPGAGSELTMSAK